MFDNTLVIELIKLLAAAVIGGIIASLIDEIPQIVGAPKLKIIGIDFHASYNSFTFLVTNKGVNAAKNAVGRITIRTIESKDILQPSIKEPDWRNKGDWRRSDDAWLSQDDWVIGIEEEPIFWSEQPNPIKLDVYSGLRERLVFAHSNGEWIDIASETIKKRRARLSLENGKEYICELIVSAENSYPSKPFRVLIKMGTNNQLLIKRYKGKLPSRKNHLTPAPPDPGGTAAQV